MDPISALGAAGSVVGIASFGLQLSQTIVQFISQARRARESLKSVLQSIQCTTGVMEQVRELLDEEVEHVKKDNKAALFSEKALSDVKTVADHCLVLFWRVEAMITGENDNNQLNKLIDARLAEFNSQFKKTKKSTLLKLNSGHVLSKLECLKWPYVAPRLEEYSVQLHRLQINLTLIFQIVSIQALKTKRRRTEDLVMISEIFMRVRRTAAQADFSTLSPGIQNPRVYLRTPGAGGREDLESVPYRYRLESPSRPSYLDSRYFMQPSHRYPSLSPPPRRDTTTSEPVRHVGRSRKTQWNDDSRDFNPGSRNRRRSREFEQERLRTFEDKHSTAEAYIESDRNLKPPLHKPNDDSSHPITRQPPPGQTQGGIPTTTSRQVSTERLSVRSRRGSLASIEILQGSIHERVSIDLQFDQSNAASSSRYDMNPEISISPASDTAVGMDVRNIPIRDNIEIFNPGLQAAEMTTAMFKQATRFTIRETTSDFSTANLKAEDHIGSILGDDNSRKPEDVAKDDNSQALTLYRSPPLQRNPLVSSAAAPVETIRNANPPIERRNTDFEAGSPAHVNLHLHTRGEIPQQTMHNLIRDDSIFSNSNTSSGMVEIVRPSIKNRLLAPFTKLFRQRDTKDLASSQSYSRTTISTAASSISNVSIVRMQSSSKTEVILKIVGRLLHRDFVDEDDDDIFPIQGSFVTVFIIKGAHHHEIPHAGKFQLRRAHAKKLRSQGLGEEWWKLYAYLTTAERSTITELLKPEGIPGIKVEKSLVHLEKVRRNPLKLHGRDERAMLAIVNNEPMAENLEMLGMGMSPVADSNTPLASRPTMMQFDHQQALSSYEIYTVRKSAKQKRLQNEFSAPVTMSKEHLSHEDALKRITALQTVGPSVIDKKLSLHQDYRAQIASLLAEKTMSEQDSANFEWTLAQIDVVSAEKGEGVLILFLCRAPKPNSDTARRYQRVSGAAANNRHAVFSDNNPVVMMGQERLTKKPEPKSKISKASGNRRRDSYLSSDEYSDISNFSDSFPDISGRSIWSGSRRTREAKRHYPRSSFYEPISAPGRSAFTDPISRQRRHTTVDGDRSHDIVDDRRQRSAANTTGLDSSNYLRNPLARRDMNGISTTRDSNISGDVGRRSLGRALPDRRPGAFFGRDSPEPDGNTDIVKQLLLEWTPLDPDEETPVTSEQTPGNGHVKSPEKAMPGDEPTPLHSVYDKDVRGRSRTRTLIDSPTHLREGVPGWT